MAWDFETDPEFQKKLDWIEDFMREEVEPLSHLGMAVHGPLGREKFIKPLQQKVKDQGLWACHLGPELGGQGFGQLKLGLMNEKLGRNGLAPTVFGCQAPDTGNAELIAHYGTDKQKEQYLWPLLNGEIRSAFAMTEPDRASSDAKNVGMSAVLENGEWVINGEKFYISGAGDPRCKIMITMVKTSPDAPPSRQQSQILVPIDTPGVDILGPMHVFGEDDAPHGHMHIRFTDVRVPESNMLLGEGRGFEISQLRLGPGRIHHCMRSIGQAERALDLMVRRGLSREAFGRKIAWLGGNVEIISRARIDIEAMRLMVLKAAKAMDVLGNREARVWVHMVKAMVPERVCQIIDQAIQMHGATGVSQWTPLARMYTSQRTLRLADGPDEVHHLVVGRNELRQYDGANEEAEQTSTAVWRNG